MQRRVTDNHMLKKASAAPQSPQRDITNRAMTCCARRIPILLCALWIISSLGGCSSINSHLAAGMADGLPHWAGGLPADAPPRPGTAKYNEMIKQREREGQTPKADNTVAQSGVAQSAGDNALGAIH
ncbi:MAG: hypothetical protein K5821_08715 [Nitrobacter sp.]|nr:hypothetical protein [Nitrobacter sp.]